MRRGVLLAALGVSLLAGCASDGPRSRGGRLDLGGPGDRLEFRADPSAVIAAELAFARLAQEKGQWTAFIETSTDDAVMFVPQAVNAHQWLRQQTNPAQAVKWQPHQVWSSCDGTLAVTKGAWQRPNGVGYFTTVWQRQKNGDYKWVLDQGDGLKEALPAPEMIAGQVAECSKASPPDIPAAEGRTVGWSKDKTLQWIVEVEPDSSRSFKVHRWDGNGYEEVLRSDVAAE